MGRREAEARESDIADRTEAGSGIKNAEGGLTSPLTCSLVAVPSDVKPPMGEPCRTKGLRGGACASRAELVVDEEEFDDEELDEELDDDVQCIEELATGA
eukprot:gene49923-67797_t